MNLRTIKKDIEYVIGSFIDDCYLFVSINPAEHAEEIAAIIDEAVDLYNELKNKVNNPQPEVAKRAYYTAISKQLLEGVDALCEKLSATISK